MKKHIINFVLAHFSLRSCAFQKTRKMVNISSLITIVFHRKLTCYCLNSILLIKLCLKYVVLVSSQPKVKWWKNEPKFNVWGYPYRSYLHGLGHNYVVLSSKLQIREENILGVVNILLNRRPSTEF